jgi:hypothetical protein
LFGESISIETFTRENAGFEIMKEIEQTKTPNAFLKIQNDGLGYEVQNIMKVFPIPSKDVKKQII